MNFDDERGSGRFCPEMLTLQYFTKKVFVWDSSFAIKESAISRNLQASFPQLTNKQISTSSDLKLKQPGILFSAWQSLKQNFAAISALFTNDFGISALGFRVFPENVGSNPSL